MDNRKIFVAYEDFLEEVKQIKAVYQFIISFLSKLEEYNLTEEKDRRAVTVFLGLELTNHANLSYLINEKLITLLDKHEKIIDATELHTNLNTIQD